MKLKIAALVASLGVFFSGGTALAANKPVVYVENNSTLVTQADLEAAVPAFQTSITRDFAPYWGLDAILTTDPSAALSADMIVSLEDYPDCFQCAGFHDIINGKPTSYIGTAFPGDSWQLTFSHELEEMLADPWINRFAHFKNRFYLVEVCDPIESGAYAYKINGVDVSDFITPAWYGGVKGRYDFTKALKKPGTIARHGYASWLNYDGTWGQVFA